MFSVYASYRGRSRRRGAYVRDIVSALENSPSVVHVEQHGVEDFVCVTAGPEETGGVVMSLLQAGDFALGIGGIVADPFDDELADHDDEAFAEDEDAQHEAAVQHYREIGAVAKRALTRTAKASSVQVRVERPGPGGVVAPGKAMEVGEDIAAAFTLVAHILGRRTKEGREATALLRAGHLQSEAAEIVGISKQAMSQRLAAAGWVAEQAGWTLAVHMLARIDELSDDLFGGRLR